VLSLQSIARAAKPEYLFRPSQILRRLIVEVKARPAAALVQLPWNFPIRVTPTETIGWAIYSRAIYELPLTEALFRLARPGDVVVDGGANVGYVTSLLAARVGPTGMVHSFEPNPDAFAHLEQNCQLWRGLAACPTIVAHAEALGPNPGMATLHIPASSAWNGGRASIESSTIGEPGRRVEVRVTALDDLFRNGEKISVIKLDLEGFEYEALRGMEGLLRERRVKAVVFEETNPFPASSHNFLKGLGFSIFGLDNRLRGLVCLPDREPRWDPASGSPKNYLATCSPEETVRELESGFWRSFGPVPLLLRRRA
jgi:FkbM family methyltransferase